MASFGLSAGTRGPGRAALTAAYITRSGRYASRRETSPEELVATGFGNLPAGFTDADAFWSAADAHERSNGRTADTRILTLPRGLDVAQQERAAVRAAQAWCGDAHAYTWAIHNPEASDGGEQPHVHLMRSPRMNDGIERDPKTYFSRYNSVHPERGGARKEAASKGTSREARAAAMMAERETWAEICNDALAAAGSLERVDARSNAARGLMRPPEEKLRPAQRSNPAALAELEDIRAAWAQAEKAEAQAVAYEKAAADRERRALAARAAQERRQRAEQMTEARLESAAAPRALPEDPVALSARQLRAQAVRAAQERRHHQAEQAAEARLESAAALRPLPHDRVATRARRLRREATDTAATTRRHQAEQVAEARLESAAALRPLPPDRVATRARRLRLEAIDTAATTRRHQAEQAAEARAVQEAEAAKAAQQKKAAEEQAAAQAAQEAKANERRAEAARAAHEAQRTTAPAEVAPGSSKPPKSIWGMGAGLFARVVDGVKSAAPAPTPVPAAKPVSPVAPVVQPPRPVAAAPVPERSAGEAHAPVDPPPYTHSEAEKLLRTEPVFRVSSDGTAFVFRPSAAEFAKAFTGEKWTPAEGLDGLAGMLADRGVQPSRKEAMPGDMMEVEYRINDLARMLSSGTRRLAGGLLRRLQIATSFGEFRREEQQKAAAPKPAPSRPKPTRAPSRDRGGWER